MDELYGFVWICICLCGSFHCTVADLAHWVTFQMCTFLSENINPKLFPSLIRLNLAPFCLVHIRSLVHIISWQNFDRMLTILVSTAVSTVLLQDLKTVILNIIGFVLKFFCRRFLKRDMKKKSLLVLLEL